jgi:hypothetical protein
MFGITILTGNRLTNVAGDVLVCLTSLFRRRRRAFRRLILTVLAALVCPGAVPAQTPADRRVDEAISRGVDFLISSQSGNGSIYSSRYQIAFTGWSVLALAGAGHAPTDPTREGEALRAAIDFLLRSGSKWGNNWYFANVSSSGMYEHGMTTLALTEVLALKIDPVREQELRQRAQQAIDLIVSAQNNTGGWRYRPNSTDADLSVSIWQLMALRSAQEAKLSVPARSIERAIGYVLACYSPASHRGPGSFGYLAGMGGGTLANQVSGLRALQVCGGYENPVAIDTTINLQGRRPGAIHFYYSTYYYAQALQLRDPDTAREAYQTVANLLLPLQRADGSWMGGGSGESDLGPVYATTMALISLEVRFHRLPMFRF